MQRPFLVFVGGNDEQEISLLYLGKDGDKAQTAFDEAAQDGANSIVRFCPFPEHSQIRTPKRDGVPVKSEEENPESEGPKKKAQSKKPAAAKSEAKAEEKPEEHAATDDEQPFDA